MWVYPDRGGRSHTYSKIAMQRLSRALEIATAYAWHTGVAGTSGNIPFTLLFSVNETFEEKMQNDFFEVK